ncbi:alpha/beta hydrolase [Nonomuraea sp. KC401]|uniref:alpha/beta hydrolase family protein n=1 Tax=unclassified Nonomuraea TaxID=2593643 RepID=UPI0010FF5489|nr:MULTISPECIES: alpha/beta hydrolase [unclassified Nonomuraea]NBF00062.1 alpha/beta hydrolase [Nonomuraea sp. K271]TLF54383.1 alpha/beta hydrolase [Nonomuraea sp. KC401]
MKKTVAASVLALSASLTTLGAIPAEAAGPVTALPAPTGDHPVGKTDLHLIDSSRTDPWVSDRNARELMVSIWYPARKTAGKRAPYLTPRESELIIRSEPRLADVPADTLATTVTHARAGVPARQRKGGWPLVVLSPGMTMPRASMTSLAEEFASRGYLVAGIEHTYESLATTFPDGRTVTFEAGKAGQTPETGEKVARVRAADTEFVLGRLKADRRWNRLIDERRIAMVGHSVGGQSAAHLLADSKRVKAAVNLDGTYNPKTPAKPLVKPFMMIGNPRHQPESGGKDGSWDLFWPHVKGDGKRWLTVTGAEHMSFADYAVLLPQLGLPAAPMDGARAIRITRAYVTAFLDTHLKGGRRPLLDRPSAKFPEVRFW